MEIRVKTDEERRASALARLEVLKRQYRLLLIIVSTQYPEWGEEA